MKSDGQPQAVPPFDAIRRWSGKEPRRLDLPKTDADGKQRILVEFADGTEIKVASSSVNGAWRVLRARLMMRAVVGGTV